MTIVLKNIKNLAGTAPKSKLGVADITESGEHLRCRFSPSDSIDSLDAYVRSCARERHVYGYGFAADNYSKFKHAGALDMYEMDDFLLSISKNYKEMEGIATPWGLAAPSGTVTGLHLEDKSKLRSFHSAFSEISKVRPLIILHGNLD